ncbi:MAG TPA: phosphate-starvation-inducible PsiE family protein [Acidimicrobiales bacterium]|nr:phosphate-starvation-inducible PsiE family protein [Acidimicrobiales bacterium]
MEGGPVTGASGGNEALTDASAVGVSGSPEAAPAGPSARGADWWSRTSSAWTERAQDLVSSLVAACLIVLAATILIAAVVDFFPTIHHGLTIAATDFLDKVLLVLILVEIVHTVVLSLRAHALAAQPFLVVGLVAVIRKILFALGSQQHLSTETLALYISMVAVFVAALVSIEVFGGRRRGKGDDDAGLH